MTTRAQIEAALREVTDPELGINVVDLGLVYGIEIRDADVRIDLTMTSRACPLGSHIVREAESAVRRHVPDVRNVEVRLVWDPPWSRDRMTPAARLLLGWRPEKP